MSTLIVPNVAEQSIIQAYIDLSIIAGGHSLRLFTNDVTAGLTPDQIDQLVAGDFTEATFPGYAAITVNSGWTYTQGNPTIARNTLRTFTRSSTGAAQLVRGYYVTLVSGGALQWFEQFDGPISIEINGDAIAITPRITLDDTEANVLPTGMIAPYGAAAAPTGWLLCNGAAVSRTTFAALFAVIGTTYGTGDGSTTFNVPDMRQRFPLGQATSGTGATLGSTGGAIDHVHSLASASAHARLTASIDAASNDPQMERKTGVGSWSPNVGMDANAGSGAGGPFTSGTALAGDTATQNPPFQTVAYIVKT